MRSPSRLLLIGIPVLAMLAGLTTYQYGYVRLQEELHSVREDERMRAKALQKYSDFAARRGEFEKRLAMLRETRQADQVKFLEGETPSIAAASLQNQIKDLFVSKGGSISSERVEKPEDTGTLRVVSVSMDGVVPDVRFLNEILFAIETRTPWLVVRELDARVKDFKDPRELMVRLKVSGITPGKK